MKRYVTMVCCLLCLAGCMSQEEKDIRLGKAIEAKNVSEVKKWLNKKADPNCTLTLLDYDKEINALQYAILKQNVEIVKLLLEAGADPNATSKEGRIALFLAAGHHHNPQIVQLLLQAGANPNITDEAGETPLMYVCQLHGDPKTVKMLLDAKADPNARNEHDATALIGASGQGYAEAVKLLLQAKADPNAMNVYNTNALIAASSMEHSEIIKILLQAGADPNARMDPSWTKKENFKKLMASIENSKKYPLLTPLIYASARGDAELVHLLLKAGADPNIPSSDMNTPLLFVVANAPLNRLQVAQMLLKAGADVNYSNFNRENKTAYEFAADQGDKPMMALLKKYGADPRISSKNPIPRKRTMKISETGGVTVSR